MEPGRCVRVADVKTGQEPEKVTLANQGKMFAITALLSTRKSCVLRHSHRGKAWRLFVSLLCPEQHYVEVKIYKVNPVIEKVVFN